jgi:hypothetical protein
MRGMKFHLVFVLAAVPACKSSDASNSVPCAPGASELGAKLSLASGFNIDLTKPENTKKIEAAKADVLGKKFSFEGCYFKSQGNDMVRFASTKDGKYEDSVECIVAGGKEGHTKFRRAAMEFDINKLRLDVTGTVKEHVDGQFKKIQLVDCEITPHE